MYECVHSLKKHFILHIHMDGLFYTIASTGLLSIGSFILLSLVPIKDKHLGKILLLFMSLSGGVLLGTAFLHMLPEASEYYPPDVVFPGVLASFIVFYIIEKIVHWRHCHDINCKEHSFGYVNLIGDAMHNVIDGIIIGGTFAQSIPLGIATTITIILHELPKEISDFGILLYAGFTRRKALMANLSVGLVAVIGGIAGYTLSEHIKGFVGYLLLFAAGGFLYIAASDLIPEMRKETAHKKSAMSFGVMLVGIAIAAVMKMIGE